LKNHKLTIYWSFLIIATLVIGISALILLKHEQERLNQQKQLSTLNNLKAIASSIENQVSLTQNSLLNTLSDFKEQDLKNTLLQWQEHEPLVRNIFIIQNNKIILPDLDNIKKYTNQTEANKEEIEFINRYKALFTGKYNWHPSKEEINKLICTEQYSNNKMFDKQYVINTGLNNISNNDYQEPEKISKKC